jgi:menaquinone-specific isochorismate synthase
MANLSFSKKNLNNFQISSFLKKNIFPQILFETRDGHVYLGLGHSHVDRHFLEAIPDGFTVFAQKDFYNDETKLICPKFLVHQFLGKTTFWSVDDDSIDYYDDMPTKSELPKIVAQQMYPSKEEWFSLFEKIQASFQQNDFQKIVPAREVKFELAEAIDGVSLFEKVRKNAQYNFYYADSPDEIFLGSSPERLFSIQEGTLDTEAVAGTRTLDKANELLTSQKDQYEHQLVVRDILEKIRPFTHKIKYDEKPSLINTKNLSHLKTFISAQLISQDFFGLLDSLHPTSAVCGMPKRVTLNFLETNEKFRRTKYAGTLGILNRFNAEMAVALRSCQISGNSLSLYSGVGVVPQSDAESEWRELDDKIAPYLQILGQL